MARLGVCVGGGALACSFSSQRVEETRVLGLRDVPRRGSGAPLSSLRPRRVRTPACQRVLVGRQFASQSSRLVSDLGEDGAGGVVVLRV